MTSGMRSHSLKGGLDAKIAPRIRQELEAILWMSTQPATKE